jgi:hypothetical protein
VYRYLSILVNFIDKVQSHGVYHLQFIPEREAETSQIHNHILAK